MSSTQSPDDPIVVADIVFALKPFVNVVVPVTVPPVKSEPELRSTYSLSTKLLFV